MQLPSAWVDAIFTKLTLVYGHDFLRRWEGIPIADVKADWAKELEGFRDRKYAIVYALEYLPVDRPPTVLQFRELCRRAPAPAVPRLPMPLADPEVAGPAMQRLRGLRDQYARRAADIAACTPDEPVDPLPMPRGVVA